MVHRIEHQKKMDTSKINDRVEYHESYIIAKNWLVDLYGILHNNGYSSTDKNCVELDKQMSRLKNDKKIREKHKTSDAPPSFDTHLEFLLAKHVCKVNICSHIY